MIRLRYADKALQCLHSNGIATSKQQLILFVGVIYRYGVRGTSMDVQGRGVVVGDGSSGQCCWRGKANCVAAV